MIKFPIIEKVHEFELGYGDYIISFVGGFSINNLNNLKIQLQNSKTNETIVLKEKLLKEREYINGQRAIVCYSFHLNNYLNLKLSIENPEVISMNYNYETPFSFFTILKRNKIVHSNTICIAIK